jgi:hypothetical protein
MSWLQIARGLAKATSRPILSLASERGHMYTRTEYAFRKGLRILLPDVPLTASFGMLSLGGAFGRLYASLQALVSSCANTSLLLFFPASKAWIGWQHNYSSELFLSL